MPQLAIPDPPKVDSYGCYDINEVLRYSAFVGEVATSTKLKIPVHRIAFFKTKLKEPKHVNIAIHSFR